MSNKLLHEIELSHISINLFSETPENLAIKLSQNRGSNKPTQLRKFFNEIVMWEERSRTCPDDKFDVNILPYVKMLKAKAAYAHGRNNTRNEPHKGLVDQDYLDLISHCIDQVKDKKTLTTFKMFMEAFMGFYKLARPKD